MPMSSRWNSLFHLKKNKDRPFALIKSGESYKVPRRTRMSKVTVKVELEEIKRAISKLTDDEREALFFELNPAWGRALQKMEKEALKNLREGRTVPWKSVK